MKIVNNKEYYARIRKFLDSQDIDDYNVETSAFEDNSYHKIYRFVNGAVGIEHNRIITEEVEVEVKGLKVKVEVKLLETEWYDTNDATSIYMYEKV